MGVFANAEPETVAGLLDRGVIDLAQLHGGESGDYIRRLRALTGKPIIQAFRITSAQDVMRAETSIADHILLDSGAGTGTAFDWALLRHIKRPYFLAGGLGPGKVERAVELLHPYAVDVSSGIETEGVKDPSKMAASWPQPERKTNDDKSQRPLRHPWGTVYPRDADERGH